MTNPPWNSLLPWLSGARGRAPSTEAVRHGGEWRIFTWPVLIVAALLPVGLLGLYAFEIAAHSVRELVRSNNIAAATLTAELVSHDLLDGLNHSQTLAALPGMQDAVLAHDEEAARRRFKTLVDSYQIIDRAFVLDNHGVLWSDYPRAAESLGKNFAFRDYFQQTIRQEKPYLSEVYQRMASPQAMVVAAAAPIRGAEGGPVLGVVVCQLRLERITDWINDIRINNNGYVFLLDHAGIVAGHPKLALQERRYGEYADLPPVKRALEGKASSAEYVDPLAHQTMVAAFQPVVIGDRRWVVVAQQDKDAVYAPIQQLRNRILLGAGVLALAALGSAVALGLASQRNRRMSLQLEERNRQLHQLASIVESSNDAIIGLSLEGVIVSWNRAAERIFGYSAQEMVGQAIDKLLPPGDRAELQNLFERTRRGERFEQHETVHVHKDGRRVNLSFTISPVMNDAEHVAGISIIAHDITQRKRAEEERDRFFDLSRDLLCIAGMDGYFKRLNPAWEQTLGYTTEEMLSKPWIEFIHPEDRAATIAEGQKLAGGVITLYFENRYRCKDGSYKWLSWTSVPVLEERLLYAVARDITDRKVAESLLQETNKLLERAVRSEREAHQALRQTQAQLIQTEKMAGLGQMVAGVAHEINNPLAFVSNNVAVLQRDTEALRDLVRLYHQADDLLERQQPQLARRIRQISEHIDLQYTLENLQGLLQRSREGLQRIQQIVRDLRDFARLDESTRHEVDLNGGIESTVNIVRGRAKKKNVTLELDLGPLPPVRCYPAKINQVFMNLISNAIDACAEGGKVVVRSRAAGSFVEIQVIDNGSGIDPRIIDKIFDPFFTTKPPGEGTGLGLSISYGIVQEHGGVIRVDSKLGEGSRFTVSLPLNAPET